MSSRAVVGLAVLVSTFGSAPTPARCQNLQLPFQIRTPSPVRAPGGACVVRWEDYSQERFDDGLCSITWYYASRPDLSDRRRLTTQLHDDFRDDLSANWSVPEAGDHQWSRRSDRELDRKVLTGPAEGSPLVSRDVIGGNVVISALARPETPDSEFSLGVRVDQDGRGFELRRTRNGLQLREGSRVLAERPLSAGAGAWSWYEVGMRTRQNKEVELRVRVFDARRQALLASLYAVTRPAEADLLKAGALSLSGGADYAELYVDPWEARWADAAKNVFKWNTTALPDGDYYLVAELTGCRAASRLVVSPFQVQVRNGEQTASK